MEPQKQVIRELVGWLLDWVEKAETDLLAYQVAFDLLKGTGEFPQLNALLAEARKNPPPSLSKRHSEMRSAMNTVLSATEINQALAQFLREWKPRGPAQ